MSKTLTVVRVVAYLIALVAGVMSYGHQVELLRAAELGLYAYAVPITVDLLAFIGAVVRLATDVASESTRKAALVPLTLAGSMAIAANVAAATNLVQIVVGVWTVSAYLIAEYFVAKLKPSQRPVDEKRSAAARKAAVTRKANARKRRPRAPRVSTAVPVSPGMPPLADLVERA